MSKCYPSLSLTSLTCITVSILVAAAIIDRDPPVNVHVMLPISSVAPGQELSVRVELERIRHCHTTLSTTTFDYRGAWFQTPDRSFNIVGPLGEDSYITLAPIDERAAIGPATVRFGLEWVCNYTHIVWPITEFYDVPVEIVPFESVQQ